MICFNKHNNKNKLPDLTKAFVPTKAYRVLLKRYNELELAYFRLEQTIDGSS